MKSGRQAYSEEFRAEAVNLDRLFDLLIRQMFTEPGEVGGLLSFQQVVEVCG